MLAPQGGETNIYSSLFWPCWVFFGLWPYWVCRGLSKWADIGAAGIHGEATSAFQVN